MEQLIQDLRQRGETEVLDIATAALCVLARLYRLEAERGGSECWFSVNRAWEEIDRVREQRTGHRAVIAGEDEVRLLSRQSRLRRTHVALAGGQ